MLNGLSLKKYKRIEQPGVSFHRLSRVNYLVGENGSGKSSILEYIFEKHRNKTVFLKDDLAAVDFWHEVGFDSSFVAKKEAEWWRDIFQVLLNKRLVVLDLLAHLIKFDEFRGKKRKTEPLFDRKIIIEAEKILTDLSIIIPPKYSESKALDHEQLLGGPRKLFHIICGILIAKKYLDNKILVFDEPEIHLHPSWQKALPDIFSYIAGYLDIQIFLATHSPFVVSSVSELTEEERQHLETLPEVQFSQKVYFLKDGQVADKHGMITSHGTRGYTGKGVSYIASKMLGVGLMDFITAQKTVTTRDAPKLVLCEGEGEGQDAKVYNIIFRGSRPPVLFVSCRGNTQLHKTFRLLKEVEPGLSANFEVFMVRDRDHEFPSIDDIEEYEAENEHCKVLRRRAIEAYLFNSETAKLVLREFGKNLTKDKKEMMDNLQELAQISAERGIPGDAYKSELEQTFNRVTEGLGKRLKSDGTTLAEKIAWLITPKTRVYKELRREIFRR